MLLSMQRRTSYTDSMNDLERLFLKPPDPLNL
jgi:hypothetical protein